MGNLYLVLGNILLKQYFLSLVGFLFIIVQYHDENNIKSINENNEMVAAVLMDGFAALHSEFPGRDLSGGHSASAST